MSTEEMQEKLLSLKAEGEDTPDATSDNTEGTEDLGQEEPQDLQEGQDKTNV